MGLHEELNRWCAGEDNIDTTKARAYVRHLLKENNDLGATCTRLWNLFRLWVWSDSEHLRDGNTPS